MQKLEAVAIHMEKEIKDIKVLFPKSISLEEIEMAKCSEIFSEEVVLFLDALSKELLRDSNVKEFPDVATLAFFCRKSNLLKLKNQYTNPEIIRLGRGVVFHIAPSNVPVNFAYSLVSGLLSGNVNIVKVPSKDFKQINLICEIISKISNNKEFQNVAKQIILVKYDKSSNITNTLSSICDARVIWGGDNTIDHIRESKTPAKAFDITFVDRYSLCVINADTYLLEENKEKLAQGFYNDTYLFDQNACTAPHLVIWIGSEENIEKSKTIFWNLVEDLVSKKYDKIPAVVAVNKLTSFYTQAFDIPDVKIKKSNDNAVWRIQLNNISKEIEKYKCTNGYFSEYSMDSLSDLQQIVTKKYQTMSYYGFKKMELTQFIRDSKLIGIDRVIPIGRTLDFSLIWDGYDLIRSLSRVCDISSHKDEA